MDTELKEKISELEKKIDSISLVVDKMRKYFMITMWVTIVFLVLPIIGLFFVLPIFLSNYVGALGGGLF